jgi:hypothetical protein
MVNLARRGFFSHFPEMRQFIAVKKTSILVFFGRIADAILHGILTHFDLTADPPIDAFTLSSVYILLHVVMCLRCIPVTMPK